MIIWLTYTTQPSAPRMQNNSERICAVNVIHCETRLYRLFSLSGPGATWAILIQLSVRSRIPSGIQIHDRVPGAAEAATGRGGGGGGGRAAPDAAVLRRRVHHVERRTARRGRGALSPLALPAPVSPSSPAASYPNRPILLFSSSSSSSSVLILLLIVILLLLLRLFLAPPRSSFSSSSSWLSFALSALFLPLLLLLAPRSPTSSRCVVVFVRRRHRRRLFTSSSIPGPLADSIRDLVPGGNKGFSRGGEHGWPFDFSRSLRPSPWNPSL